MGLLNIGTLFVTLTVLLNSIELSSQAINIQPPPADRPGPPSYEIRRGVLHLTGYSVGAEAIVIDNYFLGTREHGLFRAVDPYDELSLVSLRTGRFVSVSARFRANLLRRYDLQMQHLNVSGESHPTRTP